MDEQQQRILDLEALVSEQTQLRQRTLAERKVTSERARAHRAVRGARMLARRQRRACVQCFGEWVRQQQAARCSTLREESEAMRRQLSEVAVRPRVQQQQQQQQEEEKEEVVVVAAAGITAVATVRDQTQQPMTSVAVSSGIAGPAMRRGELVSKPELKPEFTSSVIEEGGEENATTVKEIVPALIDSACDAAVTDAA
eukprot:COSAG01_NODE_21619_length_893_cov_1.530227_1_plen_197_part_10